MSTRIPIRFGLAKGGLATALLAALSACGGGAGADVSGRDGTGGAMTGSGGGGSPATGGASGLAGTSGTGGSHGGSGGAVTASGGDGGHGGTFGGTGGNSGPAGLGGANTGAGAARGGSAGTLGASGGNAGMVAPGCAGLSLPATSDYGSPGPFATMTVDSTGPDGQYTLIRPAVLGQNGVLHPIATWGNGITTTPVLYPGLLNAIASQGFVVIASNSPAVTGQLMTAGLEWLIAQNGAPGELQGKLLTTCAASIGYSLGGGAAVTAGSHPNVVTTVSFHGLEGPAEMLHGPLLLFTSTGDTFVTAAGYVTPTYDRSTVQTFYATLTGGSHLTPIGDAGDERAPAIAWLRLWVYDDQAARRYFDGADCGLCTAPWTNPQKKNWR